MSTHKPMEKIYLLDALKANVKNKIDRLQQELSNKKNSVKQKKILLATLETLNRDKEYIELASQFQEAHQKIVKSSHKQAAKGQGVSYEEWAADQSYGVMVTLFLKHMDHKYKLLAEIDTLKGQLKKEAEAVKLKFPKAVTTFMPKSVRTKGMNEGLQEIKRIRDELHALEQLKEKVVILDLPVGNLSQEHRGLVRLSEGLQDIQNRCYSEGHKARRSKSDHRAS